MSIEHTAHSVTFTGSDVQVYGLITLKHGIALYLKTDGRMMPNRSYTPANMRAAVSRITGKSYARSRKGLEAAFVDVCTVLEDIRIARAEGAE